MAPERFHGRSDRRSDVYGLGVTLYELLTLRPAFDGADQPRLMQQILVARPPAPHTLDRHVPRDLETICLKAMAREPSDRYASAVDLAEDLRRFLADRTILARRSPPHERLWRWCRRNPAVALLLSAVAVLLIVIAVSSSVAAGRYKGQLLRANSEWRRANRAESDALEKLQAARVQKQRAAELAAGATFDRGIALCEQGEPDRGLLLLAESLSPDARPGGQLPPFAAGADDPVGHRGLDGPLAGTRGIPRP